MSRKKGVTGLDLAPELLFDMLLANVSIPVKIEKQLTCLFSETLTKISFIVWKHQTFTSSLTKTWFYYLKNQSLGTAANTNFCDFNENKKCFFNCIVTDGSIFLRLKENTA